MDKANRTFKAAIFDMDGLILDSERTVLSCWEKIGEKYGFKDIVTYGISVIGKNKKATVDEFERYHLHHLSRLAIKPGLTGMWQTSGRSDITDFEEVVKLDNYYIKNFSLMLDVKIILKTFGAVFAMRGSK